MPTGSLRLTLTQPNVPAVASFSVTCASVAPYVNVPVNVTVTPLDSHGNPIALYTGSVKLTTTDPQASIQMPGSLGQIVYKPGSEGFAVGMVGPTIVPLTFRTKGFQTVTVTDGTPPATPTWQPLTNAFPYVGGGVGTMYLLTDGSIMAQAEANGGLGTRKWFRFFPDSTGSYVNGLVWVKVSDSPVARHAYPGLVLNDGRLLILCGEFTDETPSGQMGETFSNTGEIYDPVADKWTPITPCPGPMGGMGEVPIAALADGRVLVGEGGTNKCWIYDPKSDKWTTTGSKLHSGERSLEESFVKMRDGTIACYDIWGSITANTALAQYYSPGVYNSWLQGPNQPPVQIQVGGMLGPCMLLPDGRSWWIGYSGQSLLYDTVKGWGLGPGQPQGQVGWNGSAAVMPNGHVFIPLSAHPTPTNPGDPGPTKIYDFNPSNNAFTEITPPQSMMDLISSGTERMRMVILPTGQLLFSNGQPDQHGQHGLLIYNPPDLTPYPGSVPVVSNVKDASRYQALEEFRSMKVLVGSLTYTVTGSLFTGLHEGVYGGGTCQNSTNYPIVRFTGSDGKVTYGRTTSWSTMDLCQSSMSFTFTLPAGLNVAGGTAVVVVNGVSSLPFTLG